MGNDYPGSRGRKRAIALKVADAHTLINSALPFVAQHMTPAQLGQVQKVLDAAVVNPAVQKEYAELRRKAVYETAGGRAILDQNLYHQSNKVFEEQIAITEADKRIRLDHAVLLTADALKPKTDNPDEVAYLAKIRKTLMSKGVWLRFTQPLVRIPNDPGGWMIDPRTFEAWLSLGPDGDAIPAQDGRLTRNALLGTTVLGANYYREVYQGSIQSTLKNALSRVEIEITEGRNLHWEWERHRDKAAPLVVPISDALGGADFPSTKIWDLPHNLLVQALEQNVGGNIKESSQSALYAAIAAEAAMKLLHQYIEDTTTGAQRAVKILTVIKTVGEIAELFLVVRALVGGLVRVMAAEAAETGGGAVAKTVVKNRSPAAFQDTHYARRDAFDKTVKQVNRTLNTGEVAQTGTALNRYDLALQQRIAGWHADFTSGMQKLYAANPGRSIPMAELEKVAKVADAKWGNPMAFLP